MRLRCQWHWFDRQDIQKRWGAHKGRVLLKVKVPVAIECVEGHLRVSKLGDGHSHLNLLIKLHQNM